MTVRDTTNVSLHQPLSSYARSNRQSAVYTSTPSWNGNHHETMVPGGGGVARSRFVHIKDLQARAQATIKNYGTHMPIRTLLKVAQDSANRVATDVSFKRPDKAYVEYIVSSEIMLNIIPKHKDFSSINLDRGEWQRLYRSLRKQNDTQHGMFKEIYDVIVEDNARSGVRPLDEGLLSSSSSSSTNGGLRASNGNPRPLSMPDTPNVINKTNDELFYDSNSSATPTQETLRPVQPHQQSQHSSTPRRDRPLVHPKPESLQYRPISRNGRTQVTSDDPLAERFLHLRIQPKAAPASLDMASRNSHRNGFVEMPSPTEYTPSSSEDSSHMLEGSQSGSADFYPSSKPSGPRSMPVPSGLPPPPPKIPLDALPRAPSPAYDPAKSMVTPINTKLPPLNRKRDIIGVHQQSPQSAKRYSSGQILTHGTSQLAEPENKEPFTQPRQASITAPELYECLRTSNVLVIDARNRQEYDEGHIYAKSVICIEPLSLKFGISAEDLEETLVISPEVEQSLFERRNDFDLLVYYDQQTQSDRFLKGSPTRTEANALRALHDALYEFNDYKPLRRPPVVLIGGLEAWVDLVGPQALTTSSTAALVGSTQSRKPLRHYGRPIGRVPIASANSSLEVRKRRLREQNPLNADEERKWIEKARNEEVNPEDYQNAQSDGDADSNGEEPPSPYIQTYESFIRRFPEASLVQQSMVVSIPPPPPSPSRLPLSQPLPRPIPGVPSRPPPAVPRPSYSGVSERDSSQFSPISRQTSSAQHPLYTSRSTSRYLKLPHTGLINFGVTCYMNATIQCLLATIPLSQLFLDNHWRDFNQKNWKGSNGILPGIYANLTRSLWCDDVTAIRPTSLRTFCARLKQEWGVDRQQDAKEFFDFLVDCLHEDLNVNFERTPLRPLSQTEELQRERMPIRQVSSLEWKRYCHREQSPIADLFAGQHASRLRCTTCHNTSTTYEAFYSISVEIPRTSHKRGWDIHDCLRSYTQEEKLSKDEMWKCPYCKCEREATKQITITRAPQFLVVHFKRFEMRKGESAKKVHTPIHFPLFGLDLGSYMIPPASRDSAPQEIACADASTTPPYFYDAYAVMRHIGSSGNGGHYISLVRDAARGCWRKFDDDRVTDFDPAKLKTDQRLQNEQAYLVFYGRAAAR